MTSSVIWFTSCVHCSAWIAKAYQVINRFDGTTWLARTKVDVDAYYPVSLRSPLYVDIRVHGDAAQEDRQRVFQVTGHGMSQLLQEQACAGSARSKDRTGTLHVHREK